MTGATILLVDDEPAVRRMLVDLLSARGYRVLEAGDATGAERVAAECGPTGPDLLVTDLRLPGASGLDLATRLRQEYPGLGVIFISGFAGDLLADASRTGPRSRVLEKPFRTARLIELIAELLA